MPRFSGTLVEGQDQPTQKAAGPRFKGTLVEPDAPVQKQRTPDYVSMANAAALRHGLNPELFRAQIQQESSFDPKARSKVGAMGLGQLMPGTARDLGVTDPFDPEQNLEGSAKYMRQLIDRYGGDERKALAAYNWGMGNVDKFGLSMLPKETQGYLRSIETRSGGAIGRQPQRAPVQEPLAAPPTVEDQQREAFAGVQYRQGRPQPGTPLGDEIAAQGRTFGQAFAAPATAAGQVVSAAMPDALEREIMPGGQTYNERVTQTEKEITAQREQAGVSGFGPAAILGTLANPMTAMIGTAGQIPKLAQLAKTSPRLAGAVDAAVRGGVAATTAPVALEEGDSFLAEKGKQAGLGMVAGPVLQGTGRLATDVIGRIRGAVQNKFSNDEVAALAKLSDDWGVDLTAGDLDTNRRWIRAAEGRLGNIPLPFLNIDRKGQQEQGMAAARKFVDIQRKNMETATFTGLKKLQGIAAGEGKRADEAKAVLRMVEESGTDARRVMQTSGNLTWLRNKIIADSKFDEVERLAGKADVSVNATMRALTKAINQAERQTGGDKAYARLLRGWLEEFNMMPVQGQTNTFMNMRNFRTIVKDHTDDATNTAGILKSSRTSLKDVVKAVEQDMEAFANRSGNTKLKAANDAANAYYRDRVIPFQSSSMAKALRSDNPDDIYQAFVRQGGEWRGDTMQQKLYAALDDKGKSAVRAGIVEDAFRRATDPEHFTPSGFSRYIRETGYEPFFRGSSRSDIDGLMKIMDHISRSDPKKLEQYQALLGSMTVGGLGGAAIGGATGAGVGAVALGLATTGAMKWLLTSTPGKKLLHSANLYKVGSPKADEAIAKILESVRRQAGAVSARGAGSESGRPADY